MNIQHYITDLKTNYGEQLSKILKQHSNTMFIADEIQDLLIDDSISASQALEIATELKRQCGYSEDEL
jgi:hypothetical protein